jgi:GH25 family lysozyme M1 (1,4-beta-N-acetylmuramidase)
MVKTLGWDVANYQGNINYDVLKGSGEFIIIKVTEGVGYRDPKATRNQSEARRVGLGLGYYHFARPDLGNSPEAEAQYFLNQCGVIRQGEVLVLDYEPNWGGDAVGWCKKWLDYVYSKTQTRPLIYLNQAQTTSTRFNWKPIVDADYGLWIAAYTNDPNVNTGKIGPWPLAAMQQYTSTGRYPGIIGNTDGNVFFGDINAFKRYGYKGNTTPTPTPPTTPTVPCIDYIEFIKAAYLILTGQLPSQGEIDFRVSQKLPPTDLLNDITRGDSRFYNVWIKPHVIGSLEDAPSQALLDVLKKRFNLV